jgi:hypothetical protein
MTSKVFAASALCINLYKNNHGIYISNRTYEPVFAVLKLHVTELALHSTNVYVEYRLPVALPSGLLCGPYCWIMRLWSHSRTGNHFFLRELIPVIGVDGLQTSLALYLWTWNVWTSGVQSRHISLDGNKRSIQQYIYCRWHAANFTD